MLIQLAVFLIHPVLCFEGRQYIVWPPALPIWMEFWAAATADRPVEEYPIPGNVVFVPVDEMGRPGAPGATGVRMEAFVAGTEPRAAEGVPPSEP